MTSISRLGKCTNDLNTSMDWLVNVTKKMGNVKEERA